MSTLKKAALMGSSVFYRMLTAFASFAIAARFLGPQRFGILMYWTGAGVILGLLTNFGLPTFLLKEIGGDRQSARNRLSSALSAKLILLGGVTPVFCAFVFWRHAAEWCVAVAMFGAMITESGIEMLCTGFRANDRFDLEARIAMFAGTIYAASSALTSYVSRDEGFVALAMLGGRLFIFWLAWTTLRISLGTLRLAPLREGYQTLKQTTNYAIDSILTSSFGQIDNIAIAQCIGSAGVGIFQGGMRMFLAGSQVGAILANIFIPSAASQVASGGNGIAAETQRIQVSFLGSGLLIGVILVVAGPGVVQIAYGPPYHDLIALMAPFGILFATRFAAAAWGLLLTTHGMQSFRATASAAHWLAIAIIAVPMMKYFGLSGWIWALILGNFFLLVTYAARCLRSGIGKSKIFVAGIFVICFTWGLGHVMKLVVLPKM